MMPDPAASPPPELPALARSLPVAEALPALRRALEDPGAAVLQAPPGAGKTTLVPLALLEAAGDTPWLAGRRIVMLEPRRLAARAAAQRMADLLGEPVDATVGYRMRLDTRIGPSTRIEVVTEGILVRLLQADASLDGVGLVIFDEFHERSLDADLGLALTLEVRRLLRPELRLLVMSATLDGAAVARLLGDAPLITSTGRSFPVALRYLERPPPERFVAAMAGAIGTALEESAVEAAGGAAGDVLAFLPGAAEIRRVAQRLAEDGLPATVEVLPLYGDLPQAAQDAALRPAPPGRRKIVLATTIAETSLTIEGIRSVVDGGLTRAPRFEPRSGMTRLETVRVSQAASEQRRGRAGRLGPGRCYRLWREIEQAPLAPQATPEILAADLAPLALELARWGEAEPAALAWLDPPPAAAFTQARMLLRSLGALGEDGRITETGRAMAAIGLHPRLAHMVLRGRALGLGRLACEVAALLAERDVVKAAPGQRDSDLRLRLELLRGGDDAGLPGLSVDRGALRQAREAARQWQRQLGLGRAAARAERDRGDDRGGDIGELGLLVALAYPDRIAQRRPGAPGQFRLANGRGAELHQADPLATAEFLAVAELDAGERSPGRQARIFRCAPLTREDLETAFAERIETVDNVAWDRREEAVLARRQRRLDALVLREESLRDGPREPVVAALVEGIRQLGLAALPWERSAASWRERVLFLRRLEGADAGWPDLGDAALLATLEEWLGPFLGGITRRSQLDRIDLGAALKTLLTWEQGQALDRLAPTHVTVPSGSRLPVDYGAGEAPLLAVRLQELFGTAETPAIAGGRVPLLLHLLSPAGRPLQVTRDLAGFWASSYRAVRSDMRGRYPKHPWPEDPLHALPTARARRSREPDR